MPEETPVQKPANELKTGQRAEHSAVQGASTSSAPAPSVNVAKLIADNEALRAQLADRDGQIKRDQGRAERLAADVAGLREAMAKQQREAEQAAQPKGGGVFVPLEEPWSGYLDMLAKARGKSAGESAQELLIEVLNAYARQ